jgi:glycosyltransferase involved in cell wall biosynthesis
MKILHILSTPRAEGTPNLVLDWLSTGAHEQSVYVLNSQPADLADRFRQGAVWYGASDFFCQGKLKFPRMAQCVWQICRELQPDVVLCWPTGFANWVCLGARLAGVKKLLVHCGNPTNRGFKADWITRYVQWPLAIFGAQCVCCSDYVRDSFCVVPLVPDHLFRTVYNCARGETVAHRAQAVRNRHNQNGAKVAIMVATLERHKDHCTLLAAVRLVLKTEPNFKLHLVGDGSLRNTLVTLSAELGVAEIVEFMGTRQDVPELLGQADLFVLSTTQQEGLGSVLIEALAAGLPVVASDVSACRELLADGRYGLLVPPANPAALAEAILVTLSLKSTDTAAGVEYAKSFTPQKMIVEYLSPSAKNTSKIDLLHESSI